MVTGREGQPKRLSLARSGLDGYSGDSDSAPMPSTLPSLLRIALVCCVILAAVPGHGKKKELPAIRWKAGAPGCEFQRGDDGRYRWRMVGDDLDVTLLMDSQELAKSQHRLYKPLGVYMSVSYTGQDKFDFPADLRMEFVGIEKFRAQPAGKCRADGALAGAGNAHHYHDHLWRVTACPPNFARIIARSLRA